MAFRLGAPPLPRHGAGRFLFLIRDGSSSRAWSGKTTVLIRTEETVDILLDVTNPGQWMAHCHIAEHHESRMVFGQARDTPDTRARPRLPGLPGCSRMINLRSAPQPKRAQNRRLAGVELRA